MVGGHLLGLACHLAVSDNGHFPGLTRRPGETRVVPVTRQRLDRVRTVRPRVEPPSPIRIVRPGLISLVPRTLQHPLAGEVLRDQQPQRLEVAVVLLPPELLLRRPAGGGILERRRRAIHAGQADVHPAVLLGVEVHRHLQRSQIGQAARHVRRPRGRRKEPRGDYHKTNLRKHPRHRQQQPQRGQRPSPRTSHARHPHHRPDARQDNPHQRNHDRRESHAHRYHGPRVATFRRKGAHHGRGNLRRRRTVMRRMPGRFRTPHAPRLAG